MPNDAVARYISALHRHRAKVMSVVMLITVGALYMASKLETRFLIEDFFEYSGNPELPVLRRLNTSFGGTSKEVVVVVEAPTVFDAEVVAFVRAATDRLVNSEHFSRVRSLTTVVVPRSGDDDSVYVGNLIGSDSSPAALARAKSAALSSSLVRRNLVSEDGTLTAIAAEIAADVNDKSSMQKRKNAAVDYAKQALQALHAPPGVTTHISGAPVIEREITHLIDSDQRTLLPIELALMITLLIIVFRSWHGVFHCFVAIVLSAIWAMGSLSLFFNRPIDALASAIPITLLVYGAVDPIFVLTRFRGKVAAGMEKREAVIASYRELLVPCFLTSLTTAAAFAAFATMRLPTVVVFGVVTALGVSYAFINTVVVLPIMLMALPPPHTAAVNVEVGSYPWLENWVSSLGRWSTRHARSMAVVCAILLAAGLVALPRLHVNANTFDLLPQGEILSTARLIDDKLSGLGRHTVFFEGAEGSMKSPQFVAATAAFDADLRKEAGVTSTIALTSLLGEMHGAFTGQAVLPSSRNLIAQYLAIIAPADRGEFVSDDYAKGQLTFFLQSTGTETWRETRRHVEAKLLEFFPPSSGVTASLSGIDTVYDRAMDDVVIEMLWGFGLGFLIVVLGQILILRSVRAGLLSILPNLVPTLSCFVAFVLGGIDLRLGTTLFMSVSIGALFNTTIHLAARVLSHMRSGQRDADVILDEAMRKVIPPSAFTALILSVGFSVFIWSSYPDLHAFGILSTVSIVIGLLADTFITPVLFRAFLLLPASVKKEVKS